MAADCSVTTPPLHSPATERATENAGPHTSRPPLFPSGRSARLARRLLWIGFALFLLCISVGLSWDRQWHTTHVFETAFSPPHLFIYSTLLLSATFVVYTVYAPHGRAVYGAGYRLPLFDFPVPGPLALLGAGYVLFGLAGAFDLTWHTLFGLDETTWSFPHAMIGHAILLSCWGYMSAFRSISRTPVVTGLAAWLVGFVAANTAQDLFGGPIVKNLLPQVTRAAAQLPALVQDANFQHTARIYLAWNLNRTNPLFIPLVVLTIGLAVGVLVRALGSTVRVLGVTAMAFGVSMLGEARYFSTGPVLARLLWLVPLPVVLAAAIYLGSRHRLGERAGWLLLGWLSGLWALAWPLVGSALADPGPRHPNLPPVAWLLLALSGPLGLLGGWLGDQAGRMVLEPTRRRVLAWAIGAGLLVPALTGTLDLYLRHVTS